jgi:hypothetical protein
MLWTLAMLVLREHTYPVALQLQAQTLHTAPMGLFFSGVLHGSASGWLQNGPQR